eukprot:Pgem_evm1s13048
MFMSRKQKILQLFTTLRQNDENFFFDNKLVDIVFDDAQNCFLVAKKNILKNTVLLTSSQAPIPQFTTTGLSVKDLESCSDKIARK